MGRVPVAEQARVPVATFALAVVAARPPPAGGAERRSASSRSRSAALAVAGVGGGGTTVGRVVLLAVAVLLVAARRRPRARRRLRRPAGSRWRRMRSALLPAARAARGDPPRARAGADGPRRPREPSRSPMAWRPSSARRFALVETGGDRGLAAPRRPFRAARPGLRRGRARRRPWCCRGSYELGAARRAGSSPPPSATRSCGRWRRAPGSSSRSSTGAVWRPPSTAPGSIAPHAGGGGRLDDVVADRGLFGRPLTVSPSSPFERHGPTAARVVAAAGASVRCG